MSDTEVRRESPNHRTRKRDGMRKRRAVCPYCWKDMAVDVPRDGDGTIDVFPAHPRGTDKRCWGTYDREVKPEFYIEDGQS